MVVKDIIHQKFEEKCSLHNIRSEVINKLVLDTIREFEEDSIRADKFIDKIIANR